MDTPSDIELLDCIDVLWGELTIDALITLKRDRPDIVRTAQYAHEAMSHANAIADEELGTWGDGSGENG